MSMAGCGGTSLGSHGREKWLGHQNIKVEMIATNHKDKPIPSKVCLVMGLLHVFTYCLQLGLMVWGYWICGMYLGS